MVELNQNQNSNKPPDCQRKEMLPEYQLAENFTLVFGFLKKTKKV